MEGENIKDKYCVTQLVQRDQLFSISISLQIEQAIKPLAEDSSRCCLLSWLISPPKSTPHLHCIALLCFLVLIWQLPFNATIFIPLCLPCAFAWFILQVHLQHKWQPEYDRLGWEKV